MLIVANIVRKDGAKMHMYVQDFANKTLWNNYFFNKIGLKYLRTECARNPILYYHYHIKTKGLTNVSLLNRMAGQFECYEIVKPNKHQSTKIYLFTKLDWDSKSHMIGDYANTGAAI